MSPYPAMSTHITFTALQKAVVSLRWPSDSSLNVIHMNEQLKLQHKMKLRFRENN